MQCKKRLTALLLSLSMSGLAFSQPNQRVDITSSAGDDIKAEVLETFSNPWAMAFLPSGKALVTEKTGALWLIDTDGKKISEVSGVPSTQSMGQGGLGDIIVHPDFAKNGTVFISYVERDKEDNTLSGAAVEKAQLKVTNTGAALSSREVIWRQAPKMTGNGHYGHRLAISPDGYLFITSGERQKFSPAQNMAMNLGKVVRIHQDGKAPEDNPFYGSGEVASQIWTLGHRNPLGIDFDAKGNLWVHEMGPRHGDELNLIERARNYGYPLVSEGEHYSGVKIPSHESMPIYREPVVAWVPAISPAGFIIYQGERFADWKNNGFIGGLSSNALIRVAFSEHQNSPTHRAKEVARYEWGQRVREVEQNANGDIFILEDGSAGRLLKLIAK